MPSDTSFFDIYNDHPFFSLTTEYFKHNKEKVKNSSKSNQKILLHKNNILPFIEYLGKKNDGTIPCLLFALELLVFYMHTYSDVLYNTYLDKLKKLSNKPSRQSGASYPFSYSTDPEICFEIIVAAINEIQEQEKNPRAAPITMEEVDELERGFQSLVRKVNEQDSNNNNVDETGTLPDIKKLEGQIDDLHTLVVQANTITQKTQQSKTKQEKAKKTSLFFGFLN